MRYAIDVAPLGDLADPAAIVRLAVAAERSGWDGFSTWDSLGVSMGTSASDPFIALAAVACATTRLRLIASVIALPRRRPHLVAQSAATLDRLSGGRLVLGIGAGGDPADFEAFGEPYDTGRFERFDESARVVDGLLRGETLHHDGPHYVIRDVAVGPRPAQDPRPPMWVGGMRPGALRRAAAWDGWLAIGTSDDGTAMTLTPEALARMVQHIHEERSVTGAAAGPFDVAVFGFCDPPGDELVGAYEDAGATWWLESLSLQRGSLDELVARVEAGPPRPAAGRQG